MRPRRFASFLTASLLAAAALACGKKAPDAGVDAEITRREELRWRLLVSDGGPVPAVRVTSTNSVHFEEGFSTIQFDPPEDYRSHAFRWMGQRGHVRLRTQGGAPMHFRIAGWLNERVLHGRGTVMAYIDGQVAARPVEVDDKGIWVIDERVDPALFHGRKWVDLEIVPSSVAFHWLDTPELKVAVLFDFAWRRDEEADGGSEASSATE